MRKTLGAIVLLLMAVGASAGTITSVDPSTITAGSGEYFMTIYGTDLGDQLQFDGPAGRFVVDINAADVGYVIGWVPMAVVNQSGTYTVTVLGGPTGNSGPATFRVVGPPKVGRLVLNLPDNLVAIAKGKAAIIRYTVTASGGDDPNPVVKCDPPSGSTFYVGATTVNCVASNQFGESDKGSFSVYVHDITVPSLTLPGRITVKADSREGSYVKWDASAVDDVDGLVPVECDHKSGELYKVGITDVTCMASDLSLNTRTGMFSIEVVDETSRFTLHLPDPITAEADSVDGAKVTYDAYVTGTLDPSPRIDCDSPSGSLFKMGTTTVICKATDAYGASDSGKFEVTVADTTGPMVEPIVATPDKLDATGSYVLVTLSAKAYDTVDPMPRCSIGLVYANETISSRDYSISDALSLKLLAVTNGAENRIYHVVVDCTDASGNTTPAEGLVTVISRGGGGGEESSSTTTARRRSVRP
ncbi:MAG TPA: HYR domain-containing protein [Thermoanaerobaculia bacterium]|nr:HYR domain-containing protein [Thermoanaerobaculia bacterium]